MANDVVYYDTINNYTIIPTFQGSYRSKDIILGNRKITKTLVRFGFGVRLRIRFVTNVRVV